MERHFETRKQELMEECKVGPDLFEQVPQRLRSFVKPFAKYLKTEARQEFTQMYVAGLASGLERKNVESIAYYHNQDRRLCSGSSAKCSGIIARCCESWGGRWAPSWVSPTP